MTPQKHLTDLSLQIQSPVPFWFINGQVERWHISRELDLLSSKGIKEVIVHPRYGLAVDYLSDEWFAIFGWCLEEAKQRGMFIWIYDEFNWPSGTAGMTVQKINPQYQSKYLAVEHLPLREIDLNRFEPGVCMVAANIEAGVVTKTKLIQNIDELISLTGSWTIFNCKLKYDPYYVDTLSKEAVDCFKHLTYDEYYKRFGSEFGKTIRAVFTDEASIYWVSVGYDDWNLPYTDDYFTTFRERFGYDCRSKIPYLFYPGRDGAAFRADYWDHAGYLFNERYHRNLAEWCRNHGIIYTGHNNHEEPLRYQIRFQGDMFGAMRTMDIPGVDHLGKQTLGNPWISIIGHKICSSEGHFDGKPRAMSESFGVMDWDTTFTHLKRVTDWQYAQGINLLVPHAVFHTISGMTKRESPPSFFYQSPLWEDLDYFVQYVRHLEEMLCGGKHTCKVAVLYPLTGLWSSYQSDRKTSEFEHTDNSLNTLCLELIRNHIDFDIIDFQALSEAVVDKGKIKLGDEAYELLLVPSTPFMRPNEVARLQELAMSGAAMTLFHKAMEPIKHNLPDALRGAAFVPTEQMPAFIEVLGRQIEQDLQIMGAGAEDIMVYRREKDGKRIAFLLNRSEKHRKVVALLRDYPDPAIFDPETGFYTRLEGRRIGTRFQAQLRFEPNQAYFIVAGVPDAPDPVRLQHQGISLQLRDFTVHVPFNVASLYRFRYTAAHNPGEPEELDVRTSPRYISCNWDPNPPDFSQYAGVYETEVTVECDTQGISLILDKDFAECTVWVNDVQVSLEPCVPDEEASREPKPRWLTDWQDVRADVGDLLKRGVNRIRVLSPTKLSEPVRLVGDFHVRLVDTQVTLTPKTETQPFRLESDYPFYSGTVTYRTQFELDRSYPSLVLDLGDVRDAASVYVNGELVGKRLWAPYRFELAARVSPGVNELVIEVRNNPANLILGQPRPFGLRAKPTLAAYLEAPVDENRP
ncbi:MAG: glycosyl hydrolase [Armatimonadota bacterium]|nr:glycosyl hydrolase [Armatimonadota bacterium]